MKTLEIILRLIDKLLTAISTKKAQNERDKLEQDPANWFSDHFNRMPHSGSQRKTDETSSSGDTPA